MDLVDWLKQRGGIAHRADAVAHRFSPAHVRAAIRSGQVRRLRAQWIAVESAPADLCVAAATASRLTCISLARRRGWWIPEDTAPTVHLQVGPHAHRLRPDAVVHWSAPLV